MRTATTFLLLLGCLTQLGLADKKQQYDWQTGTLVEDSQYPRRCVLSDCREVFDGQQSVIEADNFYFTVQHTLIRRPRLTLRGSIEFAVKKGTVYVRDEEGRIFQFKLVQKALK